MTDKKVQRLIVLGEGDKLNLFFWISVFLKDFCMNTGNAKQDS